MADDLNKKLADQAADTLTQMLRGTFAHPAWDMWPVHGDDFVAWKKHYILGEGCGCKTIS